MASNVSATSYASATSGGSATCICDLGFYGNGSVCQDVKHWERPIPIQADPWASSGGGFGLPSLG